MKAAGFPAAFFTPIRFYAFMLLLNMICAICDENIDDLKKMSNHINSKHKLSTKEYTVTYLLRGINPSCLVCKKETRYVRFSFRAYCKEHSREAMRIGGKKGGQNTSWNKGKTKHTDERLKEYSKRVSGKNNHFWGKTHTDKTKKEIRQKKILSKEEILKRIRFRDKEFKLISDLSDYSSRGKHLFCFECLKCGKRNKKTLSEIERGGQCKFCSPKGKSKWELEVFDYVKTLAPDAISGDKEVIKPKEIDIFVPSRKIGIECHGLFWHSDLFPGNKNKHHIKWKMINEAGMELLQFFEDEWREKKEILKNYMKYKFVESKDEHFDLLSSHVCQLSVDEQKRVYDDYHIEGYRPAIISFCLKEKSGSFLSCLSLHDDFSPFEKNYYGKKYENYLSLSRVPYFLNRLDDVKVFSILLQHAIEFCKKNNKKGIVYFENQRLGHDQVYEILRFEKSDKRFYRNAWMTDCYNRFDEFSLQDDDKEKMVKVYGCEIHPYSLKVD